MDQGLRTLRERLARAPRNGRGYRLYSDELKIEAATYAQRSNEQGASYTEIAKRLGLPAATLLHWRGKAGKAPRPEKRAIGFRPVALQASVEARNQQTTGPVMVLANGIRIEGLTTSELTALVRGLS